MRQMRRRREKKKARMKMADTEAMDLVNQNIILKLVDSLTQSSCDVPQVTIHSNQNQNTQPSLATAAL